MRQQQHLPLRFGKPSDGGGNRAGQLPLQSLALRRTPVECAGRISRSILAQPQPLEALVADGAEQVRANSRAGGVESAAGLEQCEEALLHDVFGVRRRARQPPGEAVDRPVILVEQPEKRGGAAPAGVREKLLGRFRHPDEYYQIGAKGIAGYHEIVQLPAPVREIVETRAEAVGFTALKRAAAEMSEAYREGRPSRAQGNERVAAYLATRMPATYAACAMVLAEVRERIGPVETILDAGAGTGAASLAARAFWPGAGLTLIERDRALAEAAREFLPDAEIAIEDVRRMPAFPPADLVIAAYAIGEFGEAAAARLWQVARRCFVAIEPGTPRGFALIRRLRELGGHIAAPCPGNVPCPMADPDWCHFAARVERSSLHRKLKEAELGYEDEKFSYVALAREAVAPAEARLLRRPEQKPGLIVLETCTAEGLRTERVAKRDRDRFRWARRARWGDAVPTANARP